MSSACERRVSIVEAQLVRGGDAEEWLTDRSKRRIEMSSPPTAADLQGVERRVHRRVGSKSRQSAPAAVLQPNRGKRWRGTLCSAKRQPVAGMGSRPTSRPRSSYLPR